MTDKERVELNEFIAEHMFGDKRGGDFGIITETKCGCEYCTENGYSVGTDENGEPNCQYSCYKTEAPNYTTNYQPVLEKLMLLADCLCQNLLLEHDPENQLFIAEVMQPFNDIEPIFCRGEGDTIGEAICRCAVEYLKGVNKQ